MQDHTISALEALGRTTPDDVGAIREAIERDGEARARAAGAPIRTRRALLLLFDVLVGITRGTLRHDQGVWHAVRESTHHADAEFCGTFRCVAGWLVHIGLPGARPIVTILPTAGPMLVREADHVEVPGHEGMPYGSAALLALDIPEDSESASDVWSMFTGTNTLAHLWYLAGENTGGVVRLPVDLVHLVPGGDQ